MNAPAANISSNAAAEPAAGDAVALLEHLGPGPGDFVPLPEAAAFQPVRDARSLRRFLRQYFETVLGPVELPAVVAAWDFTRQGCTRELIAYDQALAEAKALQPFRRASVAVGRRQLGRLQPLSDERVVRRYRAAAAEGVVEAWHPLVFGMGLALYSIAPRQGLWHFARQTMTGLALAASEAAGISGAQCAEAVAEVFARLPELVNRVMAARLPEQDSFVSVS